MERPKEELAELPRRWPSRLMTRYVSKGEKVDESMFSIGD